MAQVIGISGFAGSGKDYVYKNHIQPLGFKQISFAWHFKADLIGKGVITYEEAFKTKPPQVRTLLQMIGTELGRNVYGDLVWCDIAKAWMDIWEEHWGITKFAIPDVRFWSELKFIKEELGGKVVRVKAPHRSGCTGLDSTQRAHPSEAEMLEMPDSIFDGIIFNDEGDPPLDLQLHELFMEFEWEVLTCPTLI